MNVFIASKSFDDDISISASVVIVSVYQYRKWNAGGLEKMFSSESMLVVSDVELAIEFVAPMVWLLIPCAKTKDESKKIKVIRKKKDEKRKMNIDFI